MTPQFAEGSKPGSAFDDAGNSLRKKEPPRKEIAVPWVDDRLNVLVEKITIDHDELHDGLNVAERHLIPSS